MLMSLENYIWGAIFEMQGTIDPSWAANIKTLWSQRRLDEDYDQKAINMGEALGSQVAFASNHLNGSCAPEHCRVRSQKDTRAGKIATAMISAQNNGTAKKDLDSSKAIKAKKGG